ncbi:hypothetical protein Q9R32_05490 [Actinotalea sp. AC32]|nr:hypothetical protein [Actinotalea sp. AC32]
MAMMEPFVPHPPTEETVAAADAGAGAPDPADGTGTAETPEFAAPQGTDPLTHEPLVEPDERDGTQA